MTTDRKVLIFFVVSSIVALSSVAAPLLEFFDYEGLPASIRYFLGFFCHQLSSRSIEVVGHTMALCARCASFYFFLAALLMLHLYAIINLKTKRYIPFLLLAPIAFDGGTQFLGLQESTNEMRILTGFLSAAACVIAEANG